MQFRSVEKKLLVLNGAGLLIALLIMLLAGLWASNSAQTLVRERTGQLSETALRQRLSLAAEKAGRDMVGELTRAYHFSRAVAVSAATVSDDVRRNAISSEAGRGQIMQL